MRTVFADTGYWAAVLNPNDGLHSQAMAASLALGKVRLITTEMVITELLAVLGKTPVRSLVIAGVDKIIANPNVEVVPQPSIQFSAADQLYRSRSDKEWSLVDCASFSVMRERGLTDALAHDQHFEQAGFNALLRDSRGS